MKMIRTTNGVVLLACAAGLAILSDGCADWEASAAIEEPSDRLPPGFMQVIPRGRITSVDEPQFIAPSDADIPDDAWVFGLVVDGLARAFSLKLLNHHEIVNDQVNGRRFAAVW